MNLLLKLLAPSFRAVKRKDLSSLLPDFSPKFYTFWFWLCQVRNYELKKKKKKEKRAIMNYKL